MQRLLAFLLGLVVGGGAVALLSSRDEDSREREDPVRRETAPETAATLQGAPAPVPTPASESLSASIAHAAPSELGALLRDQGHRLSSEEVPALLARLDDAIRTGDLGAFSVVLAALAKTPDPRATAALTAVLERTDLPLPHPAGTWFATALKQGPAPGVATAARRRFEEAIAAGDRSWTAGAGWLDLVARHGSEEDLAWVERRAESDQIRNQANVALVTSGRPEAMARVEELVRSGTVSAAGLRGAPKASAPLLADVLERVLDAPVVEEPRRRRLDRSEAWSAWGTLVPEERLPDAHRRLRALSGESAWDAVGAVEALRRRGLDVSGLDDVVASPIAYLESVAPPEGGRPLQDSRALRAIAIVAEQRITWSERAARALERLSWHPESNPALVAKKMRAGLDSPWKR